MSSEDYASYPSKNRLLFCHNGGRWSSFSMTMPGLGRRRGRDWLAEDDLTFRTLALPFAIRHRMSSSTSGISIGFEGTFCSADETNKLKREPIMSVMGIGFISLVILWAGPVKILCRGEINSHMLEMSPNGPFVWHIGP